MCSYMYLCVSMSLVCGYLWKKEGSIRSPGAGVTALMIHLMRMLEMSSGSQQEKSVLLTTEQPFQTCEYIFFVCVYEKF